MGGELIKTRTCTVCEAPIRYDRHSPGNFCSKKCELTKTGGSVAYQRALRDQVSGTTAWRPQALEPVKQIVSGFPILILSDVHAPIHCEKWLFHAVRCAKVAGARVCILNGDFVDANQISRHAGSYYRRKGELNDDLEAAESILKLLTENFDEVIMLCGNHDMRIIHKFGGEVSVQRAWKIFGSFGNFTVTARSFVDVNDTIRVVHPRQYSKIRGKLPQDLALRHQKSIITGHQHHSAQTTSPCGRYQAVDVGCIADTEIQDYVRNECNTYVEPLNGFALIYGNKIQAFDKFSPWKLYGFPEFEEDPK